MKYLHYNSPVGAIKLAEEDGFLVSLSFEKEPPRCENITEAPNTTLDSAVCWLDSYFKGDRTPRADFNIKLLGTEFQQEVWDIVAKIPYGKTVTYGDIASQIAAKRGIPKMSAQAVGQAVGRNPIAIIIPCHRVVGKNGSITGYNGGIDKKIKLLELEGSVY